eukprot:4171231-Amphidinium_carterae.1
MATEVNRYLGNRQLDSRSKLVAAWTEKLLSATLHELTHGQLVCCQLAQCALDLPLLAHTH